MSPQTDFSNWEQIREAAQKHIRYVTANDIDGDEDVCTIIRVTNMGMRPRKTKTGKEYEEPFIEIFFTMSNERRRRYRLNPGEILEFESEYGNPDNWSKKRFKLVKVGKAKSWVNAHSIPSSE